MRAAKAGRAIIGWSCVVAVAIAFFLLAVRRTSAHTPITSKYDYNRDVFPRLRDHCAACHIPGGPAPMSLLSYKTAMPWAQSIRDELTSGRMPPWPVDATSPAIAGGYLINPRDLDVIVVWASGGTPEGKPVALPAVTFISQWKLGPPDLKIAMDAEHTVAAGTTEEIEDFTLPTNSPATKWVKAADLLPGNPSIVRDAIISVENGPVLALWQPGNETIAAPAGAAFRLPPAAKLHLQIHYKKHFDQEQNAVADKSTIGLYFTHPPPSGREVESLTIEPAQPGSTPPDAASFAAALPKSARILALRPMLDRAYASVEMDALTPSGGTKPLLRLHGARPGWFRRYWLRQAMELPAGSRISVRTTPLADYSDEPIAPKRFPLQVVVDYLPL